MLRCRGTGAGGTVMLDQVGQALGLEHPSDQVQWDLITTSSLAFLPRERWIKQTINQEKGGGERDQVNKRAYQALPPTELHRHQRNGDPAGYAEVVPA